MSLSYRDWEHLEDALDSASAEILNALEENLDNVTFPIEFKVLSSASLNPEFHIFMHVKFSRFPFKDAN